MEPFVSNPPEAIVLRDYQEGLAQRVMELLDAGAREVCLEAAKAV